MDKQDVFLIASESKKEEWKRYLDEKTRNRIRWVEDTASGYGGYCVIAMKAYIEKREETFREIEEKYSGQLQGAQQVFIFHLKTGTSYIDHLEMIKGKKNWYYSVIDLDTGVPANSPHNKDVITDFKKKLLPWIETSDDEEEEKEQNSWENVCLELKAKDWKGKTVEYLLQKIKAECTGIDSKSKTKLKIIVFGNIGSGKSSLINSFMSALSGKMWNAAGEGGRDDLLYSSYGVYFEHGPDLVCYEIRGTQTVTMEDDILKSIMEEKNEDTLYVILYLINVATLPEEQEKKKELRLDLLNAYRKTYKYNCLQYLVITHMDKKYPNLKNNIKAIMDDDVMSECKDEIQRIPNVPEEFIIPVVNSMDTTMTDPYRTYFLYLLLKFVKNAKQAVEQNQKGAKRQCIIL